MTALAQDRLTPQFGTPDSVQPLLLSFPVAASTTIYGGSLVATDANGRAVPASASSALKCWGRCERLADNAAGAAAAIQCAVKPGVFYFANSGDIDQTSVGKYCYAVDDQTVSLADGAGLRPIAGVIYSYDSSLGVGVGVGFASPYAIDDDLPLSSYDVRTVRARNVVNGNIADLTAYTVASNAAVNDATLNVAGDVVLLVAQATAAQNGLYVVGTVATGTAPLTRLGSMAAGDTILAGQLLVNVAVGTVFANTQWKNTTASGVVATNDLAFYPKSVTISQALTSGTATVSSIPVLSVTKTCVCLTRRIANTSTLTVGGYCTTTGGANGVTAGALGTAAIIIEATVGAGTINNADISTLEVCVINW